MDAQDTTNTQVLDTFEQLLDLDEQKAELSEISKELKKELAGRGYPAAVINKSYARYKAYKNDPDKFGEEQAVIELLDQHIGITNA